LARAAGFGRHTLFLLLLLLVFRFPLYFAFGFDEGQQLGFGRPGLLLLLLDVLWRRALAALLAGTTSNLRSSIAQDGSR
jgi:hypothetical protein